MSEIAEKMRAEERAGRRFPSDDEIKERAGITEIVRRCEVITPKRVRRLMGQLTDDALSQIADKICAEKRDGG
jgi:hypothetical protein